jgi:enamine deaminase RidA (YjgF/YER057c/UK114 family)
MNLESLIPKTIAAPFARYSHGVVVDAQKKLVFTSGQLALGSEGVIPEGAREQAELCFFNIDEILKEAHTSSAHVVKINAFVTGREYMSGYMEARDAWLAGSDNLPASTLMIVTGFTRPEFVVEVEAIAIVP